MKHHQFTLDILASPAPSIHNFVMPGPSLLQPVSIVEVLKTVQTAQHLGQDIPKDFNLMYLWGPTGSGKSHLILAMQQFYEQLRRPHLYLTHQHPDWAFVDLPTDSCYVAYLIDDVENLDPSELAQLFKLLIDHKSFAKKLVLVSGNVSSFHLKIREDVSSRLASGLNFELPLLTDAEKIIALQEFIKARGLNISADIPTWLLAHFHRDMPNLVSIIEAVDQYSLQTKRAITLPLLKELLNYPTQS